MVFTNRAEARAAKERFELKKIIQEGMVISAVELKRAKPMLLARSLRGNFRSKIKAEADLLVKLAEAEREHLKNDALKGIGSERMVGLKMADAYKGLDVMVCLAMARMRSTR